MPISLAPSHPLVTSRHHCLPSHPGPLWALGHSLTHGGGVGEAGAPLERDLPPSLFFKCLVLPSPGPQVVSCAEGGGGPQAPGMTRCLAEPPAPLGQRHVDTCPAPPVPPPPQLETIREAGDVRPRPACTPQHEQALRNPAEIGAPAAANLGRAPSQMGGHKLGCRGRPQALR